MLWNIEIVLGLWHGYWEHAKNFSALTSENCIELWFIVHWLTVTSWSVTWTTGPVDYLRLQTMSGSTRYRDWLRSGRQRGLSSSPGRGNIFFLLFPSSKLVLGPIQSPIQWVPGAFPADKVAGPWSWVLQRSRIRGSIHPLLHTSTWRSV
jgi:hypothetical protein